MNKLLASLQSPPPEISPEDLLQTVSDAYQLAGTLESLGGERDRNFLLRGTSQAVLVKVANPAESDELLKFQVSALHHIVRQDVDLPVQSVITTRKGEPFALVRSSEPGQLRIRVFNFLQGNTLKDAPDDPRLMRNLGQTMARLDLALRSFFHPAADHYLAWDLKRFDGLATLTADIADNVERTMVQRQLEIFRTSIKPRLGKLRAQVIHNDASFHNLVVDPARPTEISGIFDFGDMIYAPLIQELAVTAAEVAATRPDPIARCAEIVAGFHTVTPIEELEFELLPDMIAARLAQGMLLDNWARRRLSWVDNREHLAGWYKNSVSMLLRIERMQAGEFSGLLRTACGLTGKPDLTQVTARDMDSLMNRRRHFLGNAEVVSYAQPLHTVKGEGVWLYDENERVYLDAYNNVPHVGHCHPRVVAAVARQTATLNTNTRYVYDHILTYSERLTQLLPESLEVCYFVSSGSEAVDLAWRLARAWTDNHGALIMSHAYHGMTDAVSELSPSERIGQTALADFVADIPAPDDFRGPWKRDDPNRGQSYAMVCDQAICRLRENGYAPAAFFVDPILSTNGIFVPAPGFFATVFDKVRDAGGLCVADEVQAGFGRLGNCFWGFETGGVIPDIVTFGKPIANGYPMGLVVTTRAIAERFAQKTEFFSTTGGNPVACAAALAVLDVIQEERLMDSAKSAGEALANGIWQLSEKHEWIADVRGSGLFIGVELVENRSSMEPAVDLTRQVVNDLRENGVLVGSDGIYHNVLKIRPPMVFNTDHADVLLTQLDRVFDKIKLKPNQ